jgi:ABC-type polysaccharide/polyol phosphate transport system ATPase subunit
MSMGGGIVFDRVSMRFWLRHERVDTLKEALLGRFRHLGRAEPIWALQGVSIRVSPGEAVGVIGHNGSGKSTLLQLAAGVLRPTAGRVTVAGRVAPLIELGAGFDPELSGRDNVFLNGALLGRSRREMTRRLDRIVAFAELERFVDVPVKSYSSGMYARLGFAIASDVDADVLLVDEVLAVGDERFQAKCLERIRALRRGGSTVFLVSHSAEQVCAMCDRALVLQGGELAFDGAPASAVARYRALQGIPSAGAAAGAG